MAVKKIDVPPAVANILVGLGNFLGKHVAHGVKAAKASLLREAGEEFKRRGEEMTRVADAEEGVRQEPEVVDDREKKR